MEPGRDTAVIFAELIGAAELYAHAKDAAAAHEAIAACAELAQAAVVTRARVVKQVAAGSSSSPTARIPRRAPRSRCRSRRASFQRR